jgi:hypothetical protein
MGRRNKLILGAGLKYIAEIFPISFHLFYLAEAGQVKITQKHTAAYLKQNVFGFINILIKI